MIELKGVSRTYTLGGETIHALDGVSLRIRDGEFVAIMGPSGSGKTTFLNLIAGLDKPDAGSIAVNEHVLAKMRQRELARFRNKEIGFVFQSFHLQPFLNAEENVALPLYFSRVHGKERHSRARRALKTVGLENRMGHRPSELSAGQRQRVSIARALVNEPKVILADEPTGNLDSKNGKTLMELVRNLVKMQGVTVVMVTHDAEMAKFADRIITIRDGRIR